MDAEIGIGCVSQPGRTTADAVLGMPPGSHVSNIDCCLLNGLLVAVVRKDIVYTKISGVSTTDS